MMLRSNHPTERKGTETVTGRMIDQEVERLTPQLIEDRRYFHQHPELAFQEENTARVVAERLRELGLEVRTGVGRTGVVGVLRGGRPGRTVLLRADMDALPIEEENDVPYRSQNPGVMHACGHDAHTAILLGVATVLAGMREEIAGNVTFAFQPAEEIVSGAKEMIEAGAMADPPVDACFGLHVWQNLPVGVIGVRSGPLMASGDVFRAVIRGRGAHAAEPHRGIDATLIASQTVVTLQSLVSREVPPLESAVVTVGQLHAGTASNIIASHAELEGTVRTFDKEVRRHLSERVPALIRSIAEAMGAEAEVEYSFGVPATVNDPAMTEIVRAAAAEVVGSENVVEATPTMGSEDMSFFLEAAPGCYFFVGSSNEGTGKTFGHHHPRFDIDEQVLPIGVETLIRATLAYLNGSE
ncbi:amidohydrolase [Sphaerobacter thermophilus DSM 20745]|uniref:Amidohydrolase n=1 Tax=Sphaerobacter thermophilus (strain ATCC 49802 / DSM 20745 / KCCM 41009 / NCIMB 13125 / S 6022) TaxID=479434 RepID=D1CB03_SPHTD|nr:amidohydrolase [Sphaerobacter thermophilus DSM 20745]